ncbi:hypothetical protein J6590_001442 [Homalodisca vitripennis]|nr:hypothetical protein J6590_001442 [Homalodisca vitripennis]
MTDHVYSLSGVALFGAKLLRLQFKTTTLTLAIDNVITDYYAPLTRRRLVFIDGRDDIVSTRGEVRIRNPPCHSLPESLTVRQSGNLSRRHQLFVCSSLHYTWTGTRRRPIREVPCSGHLIRSPRHRPSRHRPVTAPTPPPHSDQSVVLHATRVLAARAKTTSLGILLSAVSMSSHLRAFA